jgi:hypothetical protein
LIIQSLFLYSSIIVKNPHHNLHTNGKRMNCKNFTRSAAFKDFGIAFLVLGIATALFYLFDLDIAVQSLFYSPAEGWRLEHQLFWDFTYRYGIFPGYLFAVGCLVMISVSYWNERYFKYRKAAVVMVVALILGPGLLVNAVFKDHWDRPRPREVKQFGGGASNSFRSVCVAMSRAASRFPAGTLQWVSTLLSLICSCAGPGKDWHMPFWRSASATGLLSARRA